MNPIGQEYYGNSSCKIYPERSSGKAKMADGLF